MSPSRLPGRGRTSRTIQCAEHGPDGAQRQPPRVLLITIVGVAYGGTFMLRVAGGKVPVNDFEKSYFRAGHAHAGVLVMLSLVCQILVDATSLGGLAELVAREGVPLAAILMPSGFFLSVIGPDRRSPNRLAALIWAGALSLSAGVLTLGIGLLQAA